MSTRRLHKELDKLEGKAKPGCSPEGASGFAAEVFEIDREIAALEVEIAEEEARMSPAELAQSRLEWAASSAREERMYGCSLDEQIADLRREIREAERQEAEEEGGRG